MVKFYVNMIRMNRIELKDVPDTWREEVRKALEESGGDIDG